MNNKSDEPVFEVKDLVIDLYAANVSVRAVDGCTFSVYPGETLAIVGESGSGKTVMTLGPLGLLPEGVSVDMKGIARSGDQNLIGESEKALAKLRGGNYGVVFQDPISALNPMKRIGPQLASQVFRLTGASKEKSKEVALELLRRTGIPDPVDRYTCYPHEMSGGMLQRVMIALALAGSPRILIADEPTTALDATVQAQILELLKEIQRHEKIAIVLITHDIGVVAAVADRVVVLYAGRVAETGTTTEVLTNPVHPYTKGLLASVPDLRTRQSAPLTGIPGTPPDQSKLKPGCRFADRCSIAIETCWQIRPQLKEIESSDGVHLVACPVEFANIKGKGNA
jgi:oligopeptide/dipeptide ABC transporter ATP-binding protein